MRIESVGRADAVCQCAHDGCAKPIGIGQSVIRAEGRCYCGVDCYLAADAKPLPPMVRIVCKNSLTAANDQADANANADELPGPCDGCGLHVGCQCDPHCTCNDCMARHIERLAAEDQADKECDGWDAGCQCADCVAARGADWLTTHGRDAPLLD